MPNDQSHDTRTAVPANRVAQAVSLTVAPVAGSVPGIPAFTTSTTATTATATITNANGATSYQVSVDGTNWVSGLTVSGLTPETAYTLQVRGINQYGTGSAGSAGVTTGAAAGQQSISGTGFGAGPTVALFFSASGIAGELVSTGDPEIGSLAATSPKAFGSVAGTRYHSKNGKTWYTGRDPQNISAESSLLTGVRFTNPSPNAKIRISYKVSAADGYKVPGAAGVGGKPSDANASVWKIGWLDYGDGFSTTEPDVCIPTCLGGNAVTIAGNDVTPRFDDDGADGQIYLSYSAMDFSGSAENLISYVSGDKESSPGARDGVLSWIQATVGANPTWTYQRKVQAHPFAGTGGFSAEVWKDFCLPGWHGNTSQGNKWTYAGTLPLFRDLYVATGDNCEACIVLSDAATLAASADFSIIPPDSWSDTLITYTPRSYDPAFRHLILADGTLLENV